jgi:hypothetical protein
VASAYLLNLASSLIAGSFPGVLAIGAALLLIANIRGTTVAARWVKSGDPEVFPERMRETWRDRLVDQMPALVWPRTRVVFFGIAGVYILLALVGTALLARHPNHPAVSRQERPTVSIEVKPAP